MFEEIEFPQYKGFAIQSFHGENGYALPNFDGSWSFMSTGFGWAESYRNLCLMVASGKLHWKCE